MIQGNCMYFFCDEQTPDLSPIIGGGGGNICQQTDQYSPVLTRDATDQFLSVINCASGDVDQKSCSQQLSDLLINFNDGARTEVASSSTNDLMKILSGGGQTAEAGETDFENTSHQQNTPRFTNIW